jgi:hypothetical protein
MKPLHEFSDDEIDALLLKLFNRGQPVVSTKKTPSIEQLSEDELLRIRSRNHPDKWPNVNLEVYQAAVEELDRRRNRAKPKKSSAARSRG